MNPHTQLQRILSRADFRTRIQAEKKACAFPLPLAAGYPSHTRGSRGSGICFCRKLATQAGAGMLAETRTTA